MSDCKHEWSAEEHEGLRSRVCNRCNEYKVLDERNSYLLAANASGADLAKIGWLCDIRPDEYPLKAVERVVKELSAARVEVNKLQAEAAQHEKQLESADETWKELLEARARVEGLGTGMMALSMLLGHPPEGLVEAVRGLLQKQENYEHDRAAWDAAAERMEEMMNRLVMEREEARALRTAEAEKAKREILLLQQRVSDLKFALGTDATGWFDRFKNAERERDAARRLWDSDSDLLCKAEKQVESLKAELELALAMHKVAVADRDAAYAEIRSLKFALEERWADCHDGSENACCKSHE